MRKSITLLFVCAMLINSVFAQDSGSPDSEIVKRSYHGESYSPDSQRDLPYNVYWGDTHLHTGYSLYAGIFGNSLGHEEAYRLARGEKVFSSTGLPVKLSRPLDWLVIADNSDMLGFAVDIKQGAPNVVANKKGKEWYEGFKKGDSEAGSAAFDLILNILQGTLPEKLLEDYSPGSNIYKGIWEKITKTADFYYEPEKFTTFIGYEWASDPKGCNLHRNVVFRDNSLLANQVIPFTTKDSLGSQDPLDLYKWMEDYEVKTGGQILALAHNGNLSNGWMFPIDKTYFGRDINVEYLKQRAKWEPLYEVTQIKGDGETHTTLSPTDEFADYETWDVGNLEISEIKTSEMIKGEYAREALKNGLWLKNKFGINPYKFGMVGATDSHTGLATAEEDNFFGYIVSSEPNASRSKNPFVRTELGEWAGHKIVASGYQAVWAKENTREAIFDAMMRKETYATTGPRILVRFFGGWDFTDDDLQSKTPAIIGYEKGVPMGGDLKKNPVGMAPSFMVYAMRDSIGANLDRIQIVKGWLGANGKTYERIYDVAVSDGRKIDSNGRCTTPVGNTLDLESATWENTIGASNLMMVWTDPNFNPNEISFYYVRVLEIPTPRWLVYDKVRLGAEIPPDAKLIGQERAYTSPIWYSPEK